MGLADIHMHTIYSYDGTASVLSVLKRARQAGLDVIAITDHDEIRGAIEALDLASKVGIEVIPGVEITTADGDLLALFVQRAIKPGMSLIDTLLAVRDEGGIAIAPHPMAGGFSMKSLNAYSIRKAWRHPEASRVLLGIEIYNATTLDHESELFAEIIAERTGLSKTGSSDAHVLEAIGTGATEFIGKTASDLLASLWMGTTQVRKGRKWTSSQVLGQWALNYIKSAPMRFAQA
jgi:hypothetical protein